MSFLFEETAFTAYSLEHFYPMFFFFILGCISIIFAKRKLNITQQRRFGVLLALIPFCGVFFRMYYAYKVGNFSLQSELPLHLCRLLGIAAPFIMYSKNRYVLGMFYFWTLAGTLNANLTPDLPEGFPTLSYISYWTLHSGLVLVALYSVFVYRLRVHIKDMVNVFWATNVFLVIIHLINFVIGSNYFYTMHKPPAASLLDYMGPWPWYILSGEIMVFILMGLVYIPFLFMKKSDRLYQV